MARAIVQYRKQNKFQSIADLLDVTAPQNQNQDANGNSNPNSGQRTIQPIAIGQPKLVERVRLEFGGSGGSGGKVISQDVSPGICR